MKILLLLKTAASDYVFLQGNAEIQSSLMPRCVFSRMLGEPDLPAAPLSLTVAVDGQCLGLPCWVWQKPDIERPKAFHRWTGHPWTSSEWGESVIIIGETLGGAKWLLGWGNAPPCPPPMATGLSPTLIIRMEANLLYVKFIGETKSHPLICKEVSWCRRVLFLP